MPKTKQEYIEQRASLLTDIRTIEQLIHQVKYQTNYLVLKKLLKDLQLENSYLIKVIDNPQNKA